MQNFYITGMQAHENTLLWQEEFDKDYVKHVQNLILSKPFGDRPFYIHQFVKRVDDQSGLKKMYHHPRMSKPYPQPGSTLLRCDSKSPEKIKIVWTLPNQENFNLYGFGKMYANEFVFNCIRDFLRCMKRVKLLYKWTLNNPDKPVKDSQIEKCFEEFLIPEPGDAKEGDFREWLQQKVMKARMQNETMSLLQQGSTEISKDS